MKSLLNRYLFSESKKGNDFPHKSLMCRILSFVPAYFSELIKLSLQTTKNEQKNEEEYV